MEKKIKFYGAIEGFDHESKTVEAVVLTFDRVNENGWIAKTGCFDAFFARLKNADKKVPTKYEHDERVLIGGWELRIEGDKLMGKCSLSDTPFVANTVIPQLKDKTLQGASPTACPLKGYTNGDGHAVITEGIISEISLVGLDAYLDSNIISFAANLDPFKPVVNDDLELDILLLT